MKRPTGLRVALHGRQRLTGVLNAAAAEGYPVTKELVERLSPYMREHIRRFGQYVLDMDEVPEPLRPEAGAVILIRGLVITFYTYPARTPTWATSSP